MECRHCLAIFERIGAALNSPIDTEGLMSLIARTLAEELGVRGCAIRLLSRDRKTLETVASWGLSGRFLQKGPIDAERSVAEALQGAVVIVPDCRDDPRVQYPAAFAEEGLVTLVTVPLQTRGQVIGVLRLFCAEERSFSEADLEVIRVVGSYCAAALIHSMFHRILEDVSLALRSSLDLDTVLGDVCRVITEALRARGCIVGLLDASSATFRHRSCFGVSAALRDAALSDLAGPVGEALAGACVHVPDAASDPRLAFGSAAAAEGVASVLLVPLMIRDRGTGVLQILTQRAYEFSEDETFLLRGIGDQVALAARNAEMYAAVKHQYRDLAEEFQRWFEQYQVYPAGMPAP